MSTNLTPAQDMRSTAFAQGLFWMGLSMAAFIGMSVGSRELAATLSIQQVLFFRALVGLFVILAVGRALLPELRGLKMVRLHVLRRGKVGGHPVPSSSSGEGAGNRARAASALRGLRQPRGPGRRRGRGASPGPGRVVAPDRRTPPAAAACR